MSVFQLEEWWSTKIISSQQEIQEEFDHSCMVIGNIDNAQPSSNKIMIGSQQGVLRMYSPTRPNFKVEDLVLEETLPGGAILQLLLGRFVPGSELLAVAVLHPRELVVFEIIPQGKRFITPLS